MNDKVEEPDFEASLEQLEQLVRKLEAGDLPLEQSLACYEQGVKLVEACRQLLGAAEQRIAILTEDQQGVAEIQPAEVAGEEIRPVNS